MVNGNTYKECLVFKYSYFTSNLGLRRVHSETETRANKILLNQSRV